MAFGEIVPLIVQREETRPRCLTVRLPGIPVVGEFLASVSGWIAGQMVDIMNNAASNPIPIIGFGKALTRIVKALAGLPKPDAPRIDDFAKPIVRVGNFQVVIPGLFDVVKLGVLVSTTPETDEIEESIKVLNDRLEVETDSRTVDKLVVQRNNLVKNFGTLLDAAAEEERIRRFISLKLSPAPQSSKQRAAILTAMDDVQDDVATLAATMHLIQFFGGRLIPGIGQVTFVADMLAIGQAGLRVSPRNARLARKGKGAIKKEIKRVAEGKFGTQANRFEQANRAGKLGIGMSDVIQGLQSLENHTGYGLRLGPIFGALVDLYYGVLRGATVKFAGPAWDPFNMTRVGCTRSPGLDDIASGASSACHFVALRLWDRASRLLECPDCLTDLSRRQVLWGLAYAMECLYPWLVGEDWEGDLENFKDEPVLGVYPRDARSEAVWNKFAPADEWTSTHLVGDPDRAVMMDEWVQEGSVNLGKMLLENINLVKDPIEREVLEGALVASSWSLLAGLNPGGMVVEHVLSSSVLEDIRAFDGQPAASQRLGALLDAQIRA